MENKRNQKILLLPEYGVAVKKTLINALFYGAGVVAVVVLVLFLFFPKFFLLVGLRYYAKFFIPQAVAHYFFIKTMLLLGSLFLLSGASYFLLLFISFRQKEIGVILSAEGIISRCGLIERFLPWSRYRGIKATTNPLLIRFWPRKKMLVCDVYELAKLASRIKQYQDSLDGGFGMDNQTRMVAAAVIEKDGKFLITKRKAGGNAGGKWEFPGGKLEEGENLQQCLARELKEELNIEAQVGDFFAESFCNYYHGSFRIMAYEVSDFAGELQLNEHDDLAWVEPENMSKFDFVPGDLPIVQKLLEKTAQSMA